MQQFGSNSGLFRENRNYGGQTIAVTGVCQLFTVHKHFVIVVRFGFPFLPCRVLGLGTHVIGLDLGLGLVTFDLGLGSHVLVNIAG